MQTSVKSGSVVNGERAAPARDVWLELVQQTLGRSRHVGCTGSLSPDLRFSLPSSPVSPPTSYCLVKHVSASVICSHMLRLGE